MNDVHPAAALDGVVKRFGSVTAVAGVDLTMRAGEMVALLGPNGAGKTTTISIMLGMLMPDAGTARLFGAPPASAVRRGRVGAMLQDGGLPPGVRVAEVINFARGLYPHPRPLAELLATAGLTDLAGRRVEGLSGGQAQRVRFALAAAGDPDLLVLDEPTEGMDVEARRDFWIAMRQLAARGRTIVFSTHNLTEADDNADRVVLLAGGRLVADGTGSDLKRRVASQVVRFRLDGAPTGGLQLLAGVEAVEVDGDRVTLRTTDADATVAALILSRGQVHRLEIAGAALEDAFFALTAAGGAQ